MNFPRPTTPRQSILILLGSALLFAGAMLAAHYQSFLVYPMLLIAALVGIWGARKPGTAKG